MKNKSSRKSRRENLDDFTESPDDLTISPYLSSKELFERLGSSKGDDASREIFDAFGDADSDLWNKGSDDFRKRRQESLSTLKSRRRRAGRGEREEKAEEPPKRERSKRNKNVGSEPGDRGDSVGLRVIGGKFRGTKLLYAGDRRVRPMKERVREATFNLLGDAVKGKRAIDLFAGTGALAFEAISRGAEAATLFEIHFPTARTIRDNIAILEEKERGTAQKIELVTTDVFFWGRKFAAEDPSAPVVRSPIESSSSANLPTDLPWVVFCSPPYDFYVDREREMLELLRVLRERAPDGSIFVVEADDRFDFDRLGVEIPPKKRRSYPPAEVGIFYKR
ncbi:MAG: RsmD family RNA methyltransferase [Thermoguttaceae bacterium]|nr:RsmD family RNA methyltransferase [Thermoguttaceae bacterium]